MNTRRTEVIRQGRWSSGDATGHVWIVRQNWDYYHEEFYDEGPDLNEDGWAYYVLCGTEPLIENHKSRSQTYLSESDAVQYAASAFASVSWSSS